MSACRHNSFRVHCPQCESEAMLDVYFSGQTPQQESSTMSKRTTVEVPLSFIQQARCDVCDKHTPHINGECLTCYDRENRDRLSRWCNLTVDERLDDLNQRLAEIEARNHEAT